MSPSEQAVDTPQCRIELFGGLRVTIGDQTIRVSGERKASGLLAYLAYHLHLRHPRERLKEILWPDAPEYLNLAVARLGNCLEPEGSVRSGIYLYSDRSVIGLNAEHITTDVAEFENHLKAAQK